MIITLLYFFIIIISLRFSSSGSSGAKIISLQSSIYFYFKKKGHIASAYHLQGWCIFLSSVSISESESTSKFPLEHNLYHFHCPMQNFFKSYHFQSRCRKLREQDNKSDGSCFLVVGLAFIFTVSSTSVLISSCFFSTTQCHTIFGSQIDISWVL